HPAGRQPGAYQRVGESSEPDPGVAGRRLVLRQRRRRTAGGPHRRADARREEARLAEGDAVPPRAANRRHAGDGGPDGDRAGVLRRFEDRAAQFGEIIVPPRRESSSGALQRSPRRLGSRRNDTSSPCRSPAHHATLIVTMAEQYIFTIEALTKT